MSEGAKPRIMRSPGPVADAFLRSRAFIKICLGPVGSGKTMAMLNSGLMVGARQGAVEGPGGILRRSARIGVIRETYPALKSTTLKSWFRIVPESEGVFNWTPPYTHKFSKIIRRDKKTNNPLEIVDLEFEFRAIGDQSVEEACRSWEVNAALVEELDLQPPDLIPFLTGRVGRFSDLDPSLVVDPQIVAVLNMPDVESHAYQLAMDRQIEGLSDDEAKLLEETLQGRKLIDTYIQPGGMEPDAENLHNLPGGRGYYVLQIAANKNKPGYVDRMVHCKPVPLMHGMPVNSGFVFTRHVRECQWDRRRKLIVGIDNGLFAAAVFCQRNELGEFRTLGEVVNLAPGGKGLLKVGPTAFGKKVRQALLDQFPGITAEDVKLVGDPAMFAAADRTDGEQDWRKAVEVALDFGRIHKAKSNRQLLRNTAIWNAQGEQDGYYIDPRCKHLIKAHIGGYRYQKAELGTGETRGELEIAETIYTHVADAEQYAALEGEHVISDIRGQPRGGGHAVVNESDFDVFSGS
ncbi:hypothetical protein [Novosphingobium guangzhouense]|uniref:TerL n=1 Tax=Novosphingobium guangzhouense TaxID=1850347 RepID=A0A2K2G465_9SPHN|nr:hypothetical protein [Novosphingobium guangzhouense]PNU05817.1 hypothetical protein A8V01_14725 [Novosphingobium guangzhouense]